jgi:hypothetical protein
MGRTVPSFRIALEDAIKKWDSYRRALRQSDQEAFDRMMDACRLHVMASGNATKPDPLEAMIISILLEHQLKLEMLGATKDRNPE